MHAFFVGITYGAPHGDVECILFVLGILAFARAARVLIKSELKSLVFLFESLDVRIAVVLLYLVAGVVGSWVEMGG